MNTEKNIYICHYKTDICYYRKIPFKWESNDSLESLVYLLYIYKNSCHNQMLTQEFIFTVD